MEISVQTAIAKAKRDFADLSQKQIATGVSRAINHTLAIAKTAANREIRNTYKAPAKDIRASLSISRANSVQISQAGMLLAKGSRLPMLSFGARQTKRGVTVNVMGQRKLIRSAFIATMKSGHRGVFARGYYSSSEFNFRTKRLKKNGNDTPINELRAVSVPKALSNNAILNALGNKITSHFPGRLTHELLQIRGNTTVNE